MAIPLLAAQLALAAGQAGYGAYRGFSERNRIRKRKDELKRRRRRGSPEAKQLIQQGNAQVGSRINTARQFAAARPDIGGGTLTEMTRSRLAGDAARAIPQIQGQAASINQRYKDSLTDRLGDLDVAEGQATGQAVGSIVEGVSTAANALSADAARKQAAERFAKELALRQSALDQADRHFQMNQAFTTARQIRDLDWRNANREDMQRYGTTERVASQDYTTGEREAAQSFTAGESEKDRQNRLKLAKMDNEASMNRIMAKYLAEGTGEGTGKDTGDYLNIIDDLGLTDDLRKGDKKFMTTAYNSGGFRAQQAREAMNDQYGVDLDSTELVLQSLFNDMNRGMVSERQIAKMLLDPQNSKLVKEMPELANVGKTFNKLSYQPFYFQPTVADKLTDILNNVSKEASPDGYFQGRAYEEIKRRKEEGRDVSPVGFFKWLTSEFRD